jgi:hypothetical protein
MEGILSKVQMRMELDATKTSVSLVAAVLVGPAGGRRVIRMEINDRGGKAKESLKKHIDKLRPVLKKREKIFLVQFMGVSIEHLEGIATHVRLVD